MIQEEVVRRIAEKYRRIGRVMNERTRRLWAASEALVLGHGSIAAVSKATGIAESTIRIARKELQSPGRRKERDEDIRKRGGGRKTITQENPTLMVVLEELIESTTRGDPMSALKWTCKSTRRLARELADRSHVLSHTKVSELLDELGYSLQGTRKTLEGGSHPDRNEQFEHINNQVKEFQERQQPVISVDTKKKELIGRFSNKGKEYRRKGQPVKVQVHDFADARLGKAIPYGIYDITRNEGWVTVGTTHDTAEFAVASIRSWWNSMGKNQYSHAQELLITADGGGSNGSRSRLWKIELQKFAKDTGMKICVCHLPPGTSKWNKIEHRLFCHITQNWRGRPLVSHQVVVNLIANTRTRKGLKVKAQIDTEHYQPGKKISDEEMKKVQLQKKDFHGDDWNYCIMPQ